MTLDVDAITVVGESTAFLRESRVLVFLRGFHPGATSGTTSAVYGEHGLRAMRDDVVVVLFKELSYGLIASLVVESDDNPVDEATLRGTVTEAWKETAHQVSTGGGWLATGRNGGRSCSDSCLFSVMHYKIPDDRQALAAVGYHFPVPVNGSFPVDTVEIGSRAAVEVLRVFWRSLTTKWNDNPVLMTRRPRVVAHRHGQKEAVRAREDGVDLVLDLAAAQWASVSIGVTLRPSSSMTALASSDLDVRRLLLVSSASPYFVCGRVDALNYQSELSECLNLSDAGAGVLRDVKAALVCDEVGIMRTTLYSEGIHITRARSLAFHDFDFHR